MPQPQFFRSLRQFSTVLTRARSRRRESPGSKPPKLESPRAAVHNSSYSSAGRQADPGKPGIFGGHRKSRRSYEHRRVDARQRRVRRDSGKSATAYGTATGGLASAALTTAVHNSSYSSAGRQADPGKPGIFGGHRKSRRSYEHRTGDKRRASRYGDAGAQESVRRTITTSPGRDRRYCWLSSGRGISALPNQQRAITPRASSASAST